MYACVVKLASGQKMTSRSARVRIHEGRSKPRIQHRPVDHEVSKGETIRLSCGAVGFPKPTYAWYKDGGRLSNAHDRFEVCKGNNSLSCQVLSENEGVILLSFRSITKGFL